MALSSEILYGLQVRLRPIQQSDIETLRLWRNQAAIRRWFVYSGIISAEQQQIWWEKYAAVSDEVMFMLETLPNNLPIGAVSLYKIIPGSSAEFGRLMIGSLAAQGQGFAVAAVCLVTEFGFKTFQLNNIYLEVFPDNISAIKVYEKAGFSKQGDQLSAAGLITMVMKKK